MCKFAHINRWEKMKNSLLEMGNASRWMALVLLLSLTACEKVQRHRLVKDAPLIGVSLTDDLGRKLSLPQAPRRIVSMAPSITEIIFAIGAGDRLIARSQACNYPEAAFQVEEITTYPELDREQLMRTGADLLLTTDEIFGPEAIRLIEETGIPVYVQRYDSLSGIYRNIRNIGKLLGTEQQANRVADSLESLAQKITQVTKDEIKYGAMILVSSDPLMAAGGKGYLNEMIQMAGGRNIFEKRAEAYPHVTVEEILRAQPEILIIPSNNQQAYAELLALYPMLSSTPADYRKQVFLIHPDLLFRPGPRALRGLLELTHILHTNLPPDRFLSPAEKKP